MIKETTKAFARQAGFVCWSADEDPDEPIDWSSNYDDDLERFEELVRKDERKKVLEEVSSLLDALHANSNQHNYFLYIKRLIQEDCS